VTIVYGLLGEDESDKGEISRAPTGRAELRNLKWTSYSESELAIYHRCEPLRSMS